MKSIPGNIPSHESALLLEFGISFTKMIQVSLWRKTSQLSHRTSEMWLTKPFSELFVTIHFFLLFPNPYSAHRSNITLARRPIIWIKVLYHK